FGCPETRAERLAEDTASSSIGEGRQKGYPRLGFDLDESSVARLGDAVRDRRGRLSHTSMDPYRRDRIPSVVQRSVVGNADIEDFYESSRKIVDCDCALCPKKQSLWRTGC